MAPKVDLDWARSDYRNISDEALAKMLKPSFDLRKKPPVGSWIPQHREDMIRDWAYKMEEGTYKRLLEEYTYEEKLEVYYYTGHGPNRHRHSLVYGPRKWRGEKKTDVRVITEEMRTWRPFPWQDRGQESDSLWFNGVAVLGPTVSHSDALRTEKKVTFDMSIQSIGDEGPLTPGLVPRQGEVERREESPYAANDVRNPHYNPEPVMPTSPLRSERNLPGPSRLVSALNIDS